MWPAPRSRPHRGQQSTVQCSPGPLLNSGCPRSACLPRGNLGTGGAQADAAASPAGAWLGGEPPLSRRALVQYVGTGGRMAPVISRRPDAWRPGMLAVALCVVLFSSHVGSARTLRKRALHLKLTDKYEDYEYPLHSHNSHYQKNDRCPPPPQILPERACEVPSCRSDSECERHKRCCYNGCIYACLESVQPPPVLDWLVQPKPRWLGGNGWLLDGPEEVLQAEACSTTEDGDEPLHCPTGYECHIINPGNPQEGIPNRGQCIKQRGNSDVRSLRHKYYKEYFGSSSNHVGGYEKVQQKHLG